MTDAEALKNPPRLCMRCGEPAEVVVQKCLYGRARKDPNTYTMGTNFMDPEYPFGVFIPVKVPLCEKHRCHFFWRWLVFGWLVLVVAIQFLPALLRDVPAARGWLRYVPIMSSDALNTVLCSAAALLALVILCGIHMRRVSMWDRKVVLAGVSEKYIMALEHHRMDSAENIARFYV